MTQPLRLAVMSAVHYVFGERQAVAVAEGWRGLAQDPALIEDLMPLDPFW